jgi:hypothetical protein
MRRQLAPKPGGDDDNNEGDNPHFFVTEDDGRGTQAVTKNVIIHEEQEAEFISDPHRPDQNCLEIRYKISPGCDNFEPTRQPIHPALS